MEWTKIPIDLLQSRKSDKEILAITKYQLLWAMLERKPNDNTALRYMTKKQLQVANDFMLSIEQCVCNDIKSVMNSRKRQKNFYEKNQTLKENSNGKTNCLTNNNTNSLSLKAEKRREDNIRKDKEIYKESFEEFWKLFPKQRAGSKEKAYTSYCRAIKEKRATQERLLEAVEKYSQSDLVKNGYAKGCAAWLNDDRFNDEYKSTEHNLDWI